jgi:hypothetical protein
MSPGETKLGLHKGVQDTIIGDPKIKHKLDWGLPVPPSKSLTISPPLIGSRNSSFRKQKAVSPPSMQMAYKLRIKFPCVCKV